MPLPDPDASSPAAAWWCWVLGQAGVLALYAVGFRFSGGYPLPVEGTADLGLACTQVILAALLGPSLAPTPGRGVRVAAAALPMTTLAALLAATGLADAGRTALVTAAWVAAFVTARGRGAAAIAASLTLGGPLLWYVGLEYGGRTTAAGDWPAVLSPVLGICSTRLHGTAFRPAAVAAVAFLLAILSNRLGKPRPLRLRALP